MFNQNSGYSLADIASVAGRNNDGFSDGNGAWWILILFLFAFAGGWGNNGFMGGNGGVTDGYILTSDFANIERKLDSVNNGICDGFYAMNTGMLNGFSGVQTAIQNDTVSGMQNTYAITGKLSDMAAANANCCCQTQRQIEKGFADLGYNLATQECQTRQVINDATRDIIDANNAGTRSILDFLTQDKIASLTAENQSLKFAASQAAQNNYLISALQPAPVPAYTVPNPHAVTNYCGYNASCTC